MHTTLAQIIIGFAGVDIGFLIGAFFAGAKHKALRATIAERDQHVSDLVGELTEAQRRFVLACAVNARLKPHADAHLKTLAQRDAALAKMHAANAARKAAKAANGAGRA